MRGVALFKAERQPRKDGTLVPSGWVSHPFLGGGGGGEARGHHPWGSLLSQSSAWVLHQKPATRSGGGAAQTAPSCKIPPISPSFPRARLGGSGDREDGRAEERWRLRPLQTEPLSGRRGCALCPSQRAASSPFVYHTSCLLFCLLHTSSPSLIVLPAPPFGPLDFRLAMGNSNYLRHKKK